MADAAGRPALAVVGASPRQVCGVRDHAQILTAALEEQGLDCTTHWLVRRPQGLADARRSTGAWLAEVRAGLASAPPDAVLLHYSVFSFSHRGFPLFVRPLRASLRGCGAPLLSVLHEYVYPWGRDGVRGAAWAASQRLALIGLVRDSAMLAVTTGPRADWIAGRSWLPARETLVTPIFSNLPAPDRGAAPGERPTVGLFGYSYGQANVALVLDAAAALRERGHPAGLVLLGAPGRDSAVGELWLRGARERGLQEPEFSGLVPAQELSDRLASCTVLLNADPSGPSSRKTTLAAALASGRPVLALDGPNSWRELADAGGVALVAQNASELGDALAGLLGDGAAAGRLGESASRFVHENADPHRSAELIAGAVRRLRAVRR